MRFSRLEQLSSLVLTAAVLAGCGGGGGGSSAPSPTPVPQPPVEIGPDVPSDGDKPGHDEGDGSLGVAPPTDNGTNPPTSPPPAPGESPAPAPAPGESPAPAPEPGETPAPAPKPPVPFAEPIGGKYTQNNARGFYDTDSSGAPRAVRNDLGGSFPGMVQFGQSHTVDPKGNEAKNMPRLTMSREALLLVTPDPSLGEVNQVLVQVSVNGQSKGTLTLRHPNDIFRADHAPTDGRPDYVYSRRAWTGVLPWDWVQPGMELRVVDDQNRSGNLAKDAIDFAPPAELVVQSIRVGMLTTPEVNDNAHWFRSHPQDAATDYFQTVPIARMVASYYEDVTLPRVMVASGVIYDKSSAGEGGVYSGDMRENTGKSTFSVGINLANFGVTSSGMQPQQQPQTFQTATIHHARGVYTNGVQSHGLSGGNSILTLWTSKGNEFSHEIGHHYGLGHYPGFSNGNSFWAVHHNDSGWGYIGYRKRMRANILWNSGSNCSNNGAPSAMLDKLYCFAPDSMSGGNFVSSLSKYTHYTGYSTKIKIQPAMDRPVLTPSSPTGYQKWNASKRAMEDFAPSISDQKAVWFNSPNGKMLAPVKQGVPVITLLGGYDPNAHNAKALIYPALRGNWGNVFKLPERAYPKDSQTPVARECWLSVAFANGSTQRIALAGDRMDAPRVNKFHINLAQSDKPSQATLFCQSNGGAPEQLDQISIPTNLPDMPAPAIVGKEAGYSALRRIELPQLDAALQALATKDVLTLSAANQVLYDSYADNANELSAAGQQQLRRYAEQQDKGARLNRWMSTYRTELEKQNPEAQSALRSFIASLGFTEKPLMPAAQTMKMDNGNCIQKFGDGVRVAGKSLCTGGTDEQWILDARGAIHSRSNPGLCLTDQGGNGSEVRLSACSISNDAQAWTSPSANRYARGNRCLDLNSGNLVNNTNKLITYSCSGGKNQYWAGLQASNSLLLTLLSGDNSRLLATIPE